MPSFRPRISSSQMVVRHFPRRPAYLFFYRRIGKETTSKSLEAHWRRKWGLTVNPCLPNWLASSVADHQSWRRRHVLCIETVPAFCPLTLKFEIWSDHDISAFQDVWGSASALRLGDLRSKGKVMRHTENCWCGLHWCFACDLFHIQLQWFLYLSGLQSFIQPEAVKFSSPWLHRMAFFYSLV